MSGGDVLTGKGLAKVKERGKVKVKFSEENGGYTLILSVLYVPVFAYNLLSVHCLAKKAVSTEVQEKFAIGRDIWNDNVVIFKAFESGGCYVLKTSESAIASSGSEVRTESQVDEGVVAGRAGVEAVAKTRPTDDCKKISRRGERV